MKQKTKKKTKRNGPESPMLAKTRELFKEGFSIRAAMKEAGYSKSTIEKKAWWYIRQMDNDELLRGLETKAALSSLKAFRVLDGRMDRAEKDIDKIKACDAVLRSGKTYLRKKESPTTLVFAFQTFQGDTTIEMASPEKPDEIIDVGKEPQKED